MRRLVLFGGVLSAAIAIGGCASQKIVERHYYPPTESTALKREDGLTVGALQSETVKDGSPDWNGNKSFSLIGIGK